MSTPFDTRRAQEAGELGKRFLVTLMALQRVLGRFPKTLARLGDR